MLQERIDYFTHIFDLLQDTNSRLEKEQIVRDIPTEYQSDFEYILECLAGKHKFGYTYKKVPYVMMGKLETFTIKQVLLFLLFPSKYKDLSTANIVTYTAPTMKWFDFFEPIVNRTLRLGIGNSLIEKDKYAPMLAKKLEDDVKFSRNGYFVTEKLDGNRCIASYDGEKWNFTSRNGKPMHVDFDMSAMDKRYVYDGEVLSPEQTRNSMSIYEYVAWGFDDKQSGRDEFNTTSGLINRHTKDKRLVFNIFDVVDGSAKYIDRRTYLAELAPVDLGPDVRILPVLGYFDNKDDLFNYIPEMLDKVVSKGGEGLMINLADSTYLQKRTDQLLKVKKVYTMDMKVVAVEYGKGKYEDQIGALICEAVSEEGYYIRCNVGTGLSDEQRYSWALFPDKIVDKLVEVSYFSLSQDKAMKGSKQYSLRFPRLKRVRTDKTETSQY